MKHAFYILLPLLVACSSDATKDAGTVQPVLDAGPDATVAATDAGAPSDAGADDAGDAGQPVAELPSGIRDRDGRPYVSLLLVSLPNRSAYNQEPVDFALTTDPGVDGGTTFGDDFQSALVMLDGLDGTNDWNGGDAGAYPHPLTTAWIGMDALLVDPNLAFSASGYLDIEQNADAHTTCGGRWLGDDALDKTMSFLVKKSLTGVSDGVDAPAKAPSLTFPYFAEPF